MSVNLYFDGVNIETMREELNKQYDFLSNLRTTLANRSEDYLVDIRHDITERMLAIDALLTETKLVSDSATQTKSSVEVDAG